MGKPYEERRRTLNLAAYRLRSEGKTNKQIAERIGVRIEQVPGMVLAGGRISQTVQPESGIGGAGGAPPSEEGDA